VKFGEKLLQANLIDEAQLDSALSHQQHTGLRIGEALLELGYISEDNLLKFLAKEFNTRFVSTEKLSKINVTGEMLELVPQVVAEKNSLFPVLYSQEKGTMGIVSSEPQNEEVVEELRILTGMGAVQVYVASREAIRAAIKKHYKGDINAFASMKKDSQEQFVQTMELYSDRVLTDDAIELEPAAESKGPVVTQPEPGDGFSSEATSSWARAIEAVRGGSLVSDNDFIETLNILVGLLEMQRDNLQGHSAKVAKWTKIISERMGLAERDINYNIIAAYLHDLGKRASAHLTLMSIAQSEEHRRRAKRYHLTPARLFDSVHLPPQVNHIIGHLYEIFDGTGLPEQLMGDGIPTGAKIIAVVDTYEDLISNPTNPMGDLLSPEDALAEIRKKSDRLFDPQVVENMTEVVLGDQALAQLSTTSPLVLIADPEKSSTSVIELKLVKKGFRVRVARDSNTAKESLLAEPISALLVEMRLEPDDGFSLLKLIQAEGLDLPVFMTSSNTSSEVITRAFDGGVVDFVTKPYVPEVIIAKLQKELSGRSQAEPQSDSPSIEFDQDDEQLGLANDQQDGSEEPTPQDGTPLLTPVEPSEGDPALLTPLQESGESDERGMPTLPTGSIAGMVATGSKILSGTLEGKSALALIKALSGKRKTGLLSLRLGEKKGMIYFEGGHVFNALMGEFQAEEAFLELAAWRDCLYMFDPDKPPKRRVIKTGTGKLIQIAAMSS
jgi:response regulator RpfG family c-di-GMP phosphodiesterase